MKRYLSGRTSSHRPAGVVSTVLRNSSPCGVLPGGACRTSCGIGPPVVVRHAVQHRALDALRHHPGGGRATTIRARLSTRASTSSTPPTSTHAASPRRSSPGPSKAHRDDLVIATKFGMPMGEDPNQRGGSRKWIVGEVENSLRRLGTDYIDLYQMHRPDHETDLRETLAALTDLVRAGKIRAFGVLHVPGGDDPRSAVGGRTPGVLPVHHRADRPAHRRPPRQRSQTHGFAAGSGPGPGEVLYERVYRAVTNCHQM